MQPYVVLEKAVGETPLECMVGWRATQSPAFVGIPLAYAGRLDPMASGKLLVLIGEECKKQKDYHRLDKEYEFEVLFGVRSDTGDVLGLIESCPTSTIRSRPHLEPTHEDVRAACHKLVGEITLHYPAFSSKTVQGKPLHTWSVEGRLNEIAIPTYTATIYKLELLNLRTEPFETIHQTALQKINSIPPVTDPRKALGNDFRRADVRTSWQACQKTYSEQPFPKQGLGKSSLSLASAEPALPIATLRCIGSSGLYMRTLAERIASELNTCGLAFSIKRTNIGWHDGSSWKSTL